MSVIAWSRSEDEWAIAADTAETSSVVVNTGLGKLRKLDTNVAIGLAGMSSHLTWMHRQKWLVNDYGIEDLADLAHDFDERLRAYCVASGQVSTDNGARCHGYEAIVCGFGLAYVLDGYGAVVPTSESYAAVGSGARVAYGALFVESVRREHTAVDRVLHAVGAAIRHANGCGGSTDLLRGARP